jgi:hypothetical protein
LNFPKTKKKRGRIYFVWKKRRGISGDTRKSQKIQEDYGSVCNRLAPKSEKNICFTSIRVWLGIPQKFEFVLFKISFLIFSDRLIWCAGVKIILKK